MSPATRSLLRAAWLEFSLPWRSLGLGASWSATIGGSALFLILHNRVLSASPPTETYDCFETAAFSMAWSGIMLFSLPISHSFCMVAGRPRSGPAAVLAALPWLMLFACTWLIPAMYLAWSTVAGLIGIFIVLSGVPLLILMRHRDIGQVRHGAVAAGAWIIAAWAGLKWMLGAPDALGAIDHRVGAIGVVVGGAIWFAALHQLWRGRGHAMAAQVGTGLGEATPRSRVNAQTRGFSRWPASASARAHWLARSWHRGGVLGIGIFTIASAVGGSAIFACSLLLLTGQFPSPRQLSPVGVMLACLYLGIQALALAFHMASMHRHLLHLPAGDRRALAAVETNALVLAGLGIAAIWAFTAGLLLMVAGAAPWSALPPVAACLIAVILWMAWLATWGWWGKMLLIPLVLGTLFAIVSLARALATGHAGLPAAALATAGLIAAITLGHVALRHRLATWQPDACISRRPRYAGRRAAMSMLVM